MPVASSTKWPRTRPSRWRMRDGGVNCIGSADRRPGRRARGSVLARALHRAGRLPRGPAQGLFQVVARQGGPPALRLPRHLHRRRKGSGDGRGGRGPLHLRSRDARRHDARWTQGEVHDPVGLGGARPSARRKPVICGVERAARNGIFGSAFTSGWEFRWRHSCVVEVQDRRRASAGATKTAFEAAPQSSRPLRGWCLT